MLTISFGTVCMCLLLQLASGKSIDLQYEYQELSDTIPQYKTSIEEVKNLEFDRIPDEVVEEICKNLRVTIHIKNPESYINCLEPLEERSPSVVLMKREVDPLEGSGDSDDPVTTTAISETTEAEDQPVGSQREIEDSSEGKAEVPPENKSESEEPMIASSLAPVSNPTENPGSFQGGFDNILKNTPKVQNNSLEDMKGPPAILNTGLAKDQINSNEEEAKTGESQEKPTAASPNSMILTVIGALGVIGAIAFVYNFVKSRRESKELDEVIKLEAEGKELKEMKPLMRSPMAQNGSKSLEYIDADPQIQVQTDTRVELN